MCPKYFVQTVPTLALLIMLMLSATLLLVACTPESPDNATPTPDIRQIVAATFQAMTQDAQQTVETVPTGTPMPEITPTPEITSTPAFQATSTDLQFKQQYIVYGIKTVIYSMSRYEAGKQNILPNKYVNHHTQIYSYDVQKHDTQLIFSDENLPVFVLNTYGGGDSAIHDIVAANPISEKLYARMLPKDEFLSFDLSGSLYELSTDGTNNYRKIFDFDGPVDFIISSDGMKIAYISGNNSRYISDDHDNTLIVRDLISGDEISRIDISDYKGNLINSLSWAPDNKTVLMGIGTGDIHVTPEDTYAQTGCYLVDIYNKTINKLTNSLFQNPMDLPSGYKTDPFGYSYFPNSNRLLGIARDYGNSTYPFVKLYSVDPEGSNLSEISLEYNEDVWNIKISPSEEYVTYQCMESICVTNILSNHSEIVSQPIPLVDGVEQQQTVIGWLKK